MIRKGPLLSPRQTRHKDPSPMHVQGPRYLPLGSIHREGPRGRPWGVRPHLCPRPWLCPTSGEDVGKWRNRPRSTLRLVPVTSQFPLGASRGDREKARPRYTRKSPPPRPPRAAASHSVSDARTAGEEGGSTQLRPQHLRPRSRARPCPSPPGSGRPPGKGRGYRQSAPRAPPRYLSPRHTR